jgi:hypothetical protein
MLWNPNCYSLFDQPLFSAPSMLSAYDAVVGQRELCSCAMALPAALGVTLGLGESWSSDAGSFGRHFTAIARANDVDSLTRALTEFKEDQSLTEVQRTVLLRLFAALSAETYRSLFQSNGPT